MLQALLASAFGLLLLVIAPAGLPRQLLKFSGGSVDGYATLSSFFTSPSC